jgi:type I restriction enzyme S subunit
VSDLPAGWAQSTIGACLPVRYGKAAPRPDEGTVPVVASAGTIRHTTQGLAHGPTLVIGRKGGVGRVQLVSGPIWPTDTTYYISVPEALSATFLYYQMSSLGLERLDRSTAVPSLQRQDLESASVCIAPRPEQERIVAAIEEQFSRVDAGVAALDRVRQNLKRMRAAVLHAAVTGRLVSHDANDEPAERLLERRNQRTARGKRMLPQQLDGPTPRPPLPDAWVWATIGQMFDVFVGATPSRGNARFWNGDIPWVSSGEVAFGRIRDTREKITDEGLGNPKTRLHPAGTVMLAMIGEGKTRGQAAILEVPAAHNQNCASIRVSDTENSSAYIFYVLVERYERTRIMASGGNQPALNGERVRSIPVPLPPGPEQERIVDAIERYESIFMVLNAFLANARVRCESLRSSILGRAFSGRLVAQDPTDEPGSALLESVASERASSNGHGPSMKRTRATKVTPP